MRDEEKTAARRGLIPSLVSGLIWAVININIFLSAALRVIWGHIPEPVRGPCSAPRRAPSPVTQRWVSMLVSSFAVMSTIGMTRS